MKFPDLTNRNCQPECMDAADISDDAFVGSLRGLRRINAVTCTRRILWPYLERLAIGCAPEPLRILDVGCGAGDVPIALARAAQAAGLTLDISAADINPAAVDYGMKLAESANVPVQFSTMNALSDEIPAGFDVIISSLFLHHLSDDLARDFLRRCREAAKRGVLIHDLERSRVAYWFTYFGVRVISRSPVVHADGPRSVEGAFTRAELDSLAKSAGYEGHSVERRAPFRLVLSWTRP